MEWIEIKKDRQALENALKQAGAKVKGNSIHCPWHEDNHPSGGVFADDSTGWRYKCHSCGFSGDVFDVIARRDGITPGEAIKRLAGQAGGNGGNSGSRTPAAKVYTKPEILDYLNTLGAVEKIHPYQTAKGETAFWVARIKTPDGKTMRPFMPKDGGYVFGLPPAPRLLYNLAAIAAADTVVVVEGEKCCDCLAEYGFSVVTSCGGAKAARNSDWGPLSGKNVIIWPDADPEGWGYADDVQRILTGLGARVSIIDPGKLDLADGEDCWDYVEQLKVIGYDKQQIQAELQRVVNSARPKGPADRLADKIELIISGKLEAVKWPFKWTGYLSNSLLPGTVTILCGGIGASKSFMMLQCLMYWHRQNVKCCCYELEEDQTFHLQRALSQLAGISKLTDFEYIRDNPETAQAAMAAHGDFLNSFGHCLEASPASQLTQQQLADWIQNKAKGGNRIIAIDPVTAAAQTEKPWVSDNAFLQQIKKTANDYAISIVLVTHPTKPATGPDMNQLAGSAAYARFAQAILWLENHDPKTNSVQGDCGTVETEYNRTLHLLKCRNGAGQGKKIAFEFCGDSLRLKELGLIQSTGNGYQADLNYRAEKRLEAEQARLEREQTREKAKEQEAEIEKQKTERARLKAEAKKL